jgi:hypothetical protein
MLNRGLMMAKMVWGTPKLVTLSSGYEAQANKIQWFPECSYPRDSSCDPGQGRPGEEEEVGPS